MPNLLIGSYFKRPRAPVDLPNGDGTFTTYYFTPVDPGNPNSEHVASVSNPKHQQRLLAIAEGYYISEAQTAMEAAATTAASSVRPTAAIAPVPSSPQPSTAQAQESTPAAETQQPDSAEQGQEQEAATEADSLDAQAAAQELLALPLRAFKEALPRANPIVLSAALKIETAKSADEERPTFVKALQAQLKV